MVTPVVALKHISKQFGGVQALDDVEISVLPGTVHGLLGQNGSGKSTLIKILAGFYSPEPGACIEVNGAAVHVPVDYSKRDVPIGFVHQSLGLFAELSVTENLLVRDWARGFTWLRWLRQRRIAEALLEDYGLVVDGRRRVGELDPHERATVAIVRALHDMGTGRQPGAHDPRLLVLDEPSAFLPREERQKLHGVLREIAKSGDAVLLVSHDVEEILDVTSDVTVLRDGRHVGSATTSDLSERDLVEMILGRAPERLRSAESAHAVAREREAPLASAEKVSGRRLRGISFDVRPGELLGLTGLAGSGVEELPYALFGAAARTSGTLMLAGRRLDLARLSPQAAMQAGIALVPRDREEEGGIVSLPTGDNLLLCVLYRFARANFLKTRLMRREARREMAALQVVPPRPGIDFGMLSGGNQQKVLFGKWLVTRPRLLIACEPTQGVDIGARLELLRRLRESITSDSAGIVSTVDYEQLVGLCDRIMVLRDGALAATFGPEVSKEELAAAVLTYDPRPGGGALTTTGGTTGTSLEAER